MEAGVRRWAVGMGAVLAVGVVSLAGCPAGDLGPRDDAGVSERIEDGGRAADAGGGEAGRDGGECTVFPDDCGSGQNCYSDLTDRGIERLCMPYDPTRAEGEACSEVNGCGDGARCFEQTCRRICDPGEPEGRVCEDGEVCVGMNSHGYDLVWGVCVPESNECSRWPDDDCGAGKNCYPRRQGTRCLAFEVGAERGDPCEGSRDCNDGQVCLEVGGASGDTGADSKRCYPKCDDEHPCETGSCEPVSSLSHGACLPEE